FRRHPAAVCAEGGLRSEGRENERTRERDEARWPADGLRRGDEKTKRREVQRRAHRLVCQGRLGGGCRFGAAPAGAWVVVVSAAGIRGAGHRAGRCCLLLARSSARLSSPFRLLVSSSFPTTRSVAGWQ